MTKTQNTERPELSAELLGLEARLAQSGPKVDEATLERVKAAGLLALCQQTTRRSPDLLSGPLLAETILKSGEERITLSLRQYIRQIKFSSTLAGFCVGVLVGAVGIIALSTISTRVPPSPPPASTRSATVESKRMPSSLSAGDDWWNDQQVPPRSDR